MFILNIILIPSLEDLLDKRYMDYVYSALKLTNQKDVIVKKILKLFKMVIKYKPEKCLNQ